MRTPSFHEACLVEWEVVTLLTQFSYILRIQFCHVAVDLSILYELGPTRWPDLSMFWQGSRSVC